MNILAIDQGTTSTRVIVFNKNLKPVFQSAIKHAQIYPREGFVEHNAEEILQNVIELGRQAVVHTPKIDAVALTNQRETVVLWDRSTGIPVCNAVVWQCRRSYEVTEQIKRDSFDKVIRRKTGLLCDPYFSASKIKHLIDNNPSVRKTLDSGKLCIGTMDSFLLFRLTGRHMTDVTNASRTMLFNIHDLKWDKELLDYFEIPDSCLPEVLPSQLPPETAPRINKKYFFSELPVCSILGDQHAALYGQNCVNPGEIKCTFGTGAFILQNTGDSPRLTDSPLLATLAWHKHGHPPAYALEGSVFCAGAAIEWMIDRMKLVKSVRELTNILRSTADTGGVYFVPAFAGLGAPYWDSSARAMLCGMTLQNSRNEIVRAVCESIIYQTRDALLAIESASGKKIDSISVDGGIAKNPLFMQFLSDILNIPVTRPAFSEITAQGVAKMAGEASGGSFAPTKSGFTFTPEMSELKRQKKLEKWSQAVELSRDWER